MATTIKLYGADGKIVEVEQKARRRRGEPPARSDGGARVAGSSEAKAPHGESGAGDQPRIAAHDHGGSCSSLEVLDLDEGIVTGGGRGQVASGSGGAGGGRPPAISERGRRRSWAEDEDSPAATTPGSSKSEGQGKKKRWSLFGRKKDEDTLRTFSGRDVRQAGLK